MGLLPKHGAHSPCVSSELAVRLPQLEQYAAAGGGAASGGGGRGGGLIVNPRFTVRPTANSCSVCSVCVSTNTTIAVVSISTQHPPRVSITQANAAATSSQ